MADSIENVRRVVERAVFTMTENAAHFGYDNGGPEALAITNELAYVEKCVEAYEPLRKALRSAVDTMKESRWCSPRANVPLIDSEIKEGEALLAELESGE